MALELKVPADKRQFALDTLQSDIDFVKACKLGKEKTYKKVCKTQTAEAPDIKFLGVKGTVEIKSDIKTVLSAVTKYGCDVDAKSPKQVLESTVFQKFYFFTDEDKKQYEAAQNKEPMTEFAFYTHSAARSPAPKLVSHRDFVGIGVCKMDADGKKCYLAARNLPYEEKAGKEYIRGDLKVQYIELEQVADDKVLLTQFVLADPAGSIPSWIYNSSLDARNDLLVLLKGFVEGEIKPEYDVEK